MKLFYASASPFVRKVLACAIACGVEKQITRVESNPWVTPADLLRENPLSKIPCLVTSDGVALFDSPVICEYLDSIGEGGLFPPPGPARWRALKLQAVGDGIADAGIIRRRDQARPEEDARSTEMARQTDVVARSLDYLEQQPPAAHLDIGTISVACALGWLDFRYAQEDWRPGRPKLAAWYAEMQKRPELAQTAPA